MATSANPTRDHFAALLNETLGEKKPITPQMALRLAKLLGTSAESGFGGRIPYDLAMQAAAMAEELERIPRLEAA